MELKYLLIAFHAGLSTPGMALRLLKNLAGSGKICKHTAMNEAVTVSELLGAYRAHMTAYDWLILSLGFVILLLQAALCLWARASLLRPKGELPFLHAMFLKFFDRLCASVVEIFTLLGLLGTVFALLYTFTVIDEENTREVLRSFAPAFTTTISGLLSAIFNKLLYDAALSPMLEELLIDSKTSAPKEEEP